MGRYYLVGSYYDMYKKTYSNEIRIKELDGIKLSSLVNIDGFTSKYSLDEIIILLEKELGIKGINHLVVRYSKSNDSVPEHYRVIYKDDMFNSCVNSLKENTVNILGKTRKTLFVDRNNELYRSEVKKILDTIKSNNVEEFSKIYPKNNDFSLLVRRYLNSSYDNELDKEEDLKLILLEFSRYKTFRGWIVEQNKLKENNFRRSTTYNKSVSSKKVSKNKGYISTYEESSKEFDEIFVSRNNMGYDQYRTLEHNCYDEEKEEFLDVDEYNIMNDYDEEEIRKEFDSTIGKKRR